MSASRTVRIMKFFRSSGLDVMLGRALLFRTFFDDFLQVLGELHLSNNCCRANISTLMSTRCTMVIWVVEFSSERYKIRKFFSQKSFLIKI